VNEQAIVAAELFHHVPDVDAALKQVSSASFVSNLAAEVNERISARRKEIVGEHKNGNGDTEHDIPLDANFQSGSGRRARRYRGQFPEDLELKL